MTPGSELRIRLDSISSAELFRLIRCYLGTSRLALRAEVGRRILPVPEILIFEADEYLFTLAPVFADAVILPEPLTCYRMHGANLFLASGCTRAGQRQKQRVLTALAGELRRALSQWNVAPAVSRTVVEMVELEAAQLRLSPSTMASIGRRRMKVLTICWRCSCPFHAPPNLLSNVETGSNL